MTSRIGVDFDNTIVSYDEVMHEVAVEQGWVPSSLEKSKKKIRDTIRLLEDGEIKWQRLQAQVYGPQIMKATLIEGVKRFFIMCKQQGVDVFIVSHKTQYSNLGESKTDLRKSALNWMIGHEFFHDDQIGLSREQVFFESTRQDKALRIEKLGCTHFIDDLEETFQEPCFPPNIEKFLFDPHRLYSPNNGITLAHHWHEIHDSIFGSTK